MTNESDYIGRTTFEYCYYNDYNDESNSNDYDSGGNDDSDSGDYTINNDDNDGSGGNFEWCQWLISEIGSSNDSKGNYNYTSGSGSGDYSSSGNNCDSNDKINDSGSYDNNDDCGNNWISDKDGSEKENGLANFNDGGNDSMSMLIVTFLMVRHQ